jgi:hypothetical protein
LDFRTFLDFANSLVGERIRMIGISLAFEQNPVAEKPAVMVAGKVCQRPELKTD